MNDSFIVVAMLNPVTIVNCCKELDLSVRFAAVVKLTGQLTLAK